MLLKGQKVYNFLKLHMRTMKVKNDKNSNIFYNKFKKFNTTIYNDY